jgi:hypothetical protein
MWNSGRHEVAFYTQVAAVMSARLYDKCSLMIRDKIIARELSHDDVANAAVAECAGPAEGVGEMLGLGRSR